MKTIVLSGGNYGGLHVQIPEDVTRISILDENNTRWCYNSGLNQNTSTAEFVGFDLANHVEIALT